MNGDESWPCIVLKSCMYTIKAYDVARWTFQVPSEGYGEGHRKREGSVEER